jgi:hypothetical protein
VKRSTPVLAAIGIYQLVRFLALGLSAMVRSPMAEDIILRHAVIGLAAGGLLMVGLVFQYALNPHPVLILPLRLGKFLEMVGVFLVFPATFPELHLITGDSLGAIVSILVLTDIIVFLFLLLLPGKDI